MPRATRPDDKRLQADITPVYAWWKGKRGFAHNRSRPVMTPIGPIGSMLLAAEQFGTYASTVGYRCDRGSAGYDTGGWYWL